MNLKATRTKCDDRASSFLDVSAAWMPFTLYSIARLLLHSLSALESRTMKFAVSVLLIASWGAASISAFSAVAPRKVSTPATDIDKSMKNVDDEPTFDPTGGDHPALTRNNNDDVWVSQVRSLWRPLDGDAVLPSEDGRRSPHTFCLTFIGIACPSSS